MDRKCSLYARVFSPDINVLLWVSVAADEKSGHCKINRSGICLFIVLKERMYTNMADNVAECTIKK